MARSQIWECEEVYRIYVTDALRSLLGGAENVRYADLMDRDIKYHENPEEEAQMIISSIRGKLS